MYLSEDANFTEDRRENNETVNAKRNEGNQQATEEYCRAQNVVKKKMGILYETAEITVRAAIVKQQGILYQMSTTSGR